MGAWYHEEWFPFTDTCRIVYTTQHSWRINHYQLWWFQGCRIAICVGSDDSWDNQCCEVANQDNFRLFGEITHGGQYVFVLGHCLFKGPVMLMAWLRTCDVGRGSGGHFRMSCDIGILDTFCKLYAVCCHDNLVFSKLLSPHLELRVWTDRFRMCQNELYPRLAIHRHLRYISGVCSLMIVSITRF